MKLHVLQQYLHNLAETIAMSGCESRASGDLHEACDLLTSLGEIEIGQLSGLLRQAQEYRNTKDLAIPQCLRPTVATYDAVRDLKTRASAPDVNRENLVRDLQAIPLDNLDKGALVNLVKEFGWQVRERANKNDAVKAIWVGVTGRAEADAVEEYAQKITALRRRGVRAEDHSPERASQRRRFNS